MSRNAKKSLALATFICAPALALKFEGEDDKGKGAGGEGDKSKDKKDAKDQPAKLELTQEELDKRVSDAAVEAVRKRDEERDKKEREAKDERDRKEAEAQGKFKELADQEKSKREQAEAELANLKHVQAIDRAIAKAAAEHADYPVAVFNEYVSPKVAASVKVGADEKEIDKAAKEAVKAYTEANPRKAASQIPSNPARNTQQPKGTANRISSDRSNGVARSRF